MPGHEGAVLPVVWLARRLRLGIVGTLDLGQDVGHNSATLSQRTQSHMSEELARARGQRAVAHTWKACTFSPCRMAGRFNACVSGASSTLLAASSSSSFTSLNASDMAAAAGHGSPSRLCAGFKAKKGNHLKIEKQPMSARQPALRRQVGLHCTYTRACSPCVVS